MDPSSAASSEGDFAPSQESQEFPPRTSAASAATMYKNNCFCLKEQSVDIIMDNTLPTTPATDSNQDDGPRNQQFSQFGQYAHRNYGGGNSSSNKTSSSRLTTSFRTKGAAGAADNNKITQCEECKHDDYFEWSWDKSLSVASSSIFDEVERNVLFNPGFSVGTGAVRGTKALELGKHHFFEILMNTEVYGTDMMIGVGTDKVDLQQFAHSFVHFLGQNDESWGLSYSGDIHHGGKVKPYTLPFSQGTFIGVHIDLWSGVLEYYINRRPMGIAFTGIQNKILYPMISSTAARSGMCLTYCRSFEPSLQLQALLSLGRASYCPENMSIFHCHALPPGLKIQIKKAFWWISSNKRSTYHPICYEENKENIKTDKSESQPSNTSKLGSNPSTSTSASAIGGAIGRAFRRKKIHPSANEPSSGQGQSAANSSNSTTVSISNAYTGSTSSSTEPAANTATTTQPITIIESRSNGNTNTSNTSNNSSDDEPSSPSANSMKRIRLRTPSIDDSSSK